MKSSNRKRTKPNISKERKKQKIILNNKDIVPDSALNEVKIEIKTEPVIETDFTSNLKFYKRNKNETQTRLEVSKTKKSDVLADKKELLKSLALTPIDNSDIKRKEIISPSTSKEKSYSPQKKSIDKQIIGPPNKPSKSKLNKKLNYCDNQKIKKKYKIDLLHQLICNKLDGKKKRKSADDDISNNQNDYIDINAHRKLRNNKELKISKEHGQKTIEINSEHCESSQEGKINEQLEKGGEILKIAADSENSSLNITNSQCLQQNLQKLSRNNSNDSEKEDTIQDTNSSQSKEVNMNNVVVMVKALNESDIFYKNYLERTKSVEKKNIADNENNNFQNTDSDSLEVSVQNSIKNIFCYMTEKQNSENKQSESIPSEFNKENAVLCNLSEENKNSKPQQNEVQIFKTQSSEAVSKITILNNLDSNRKENFKENLSISDIQKTLDNSEISLRKHVETRFNKFSDKSEHGNKNCYELKKQTKSDHVNVENQIQESAAVKFKHLRTENLQEKQPTEILSFEHSQNSSRNLFIKNCNEEAKQKCIQKDPNVKKIESPEAKEVKISPKANNSTTTILLDSKETLGKEMDLSQYKSRKLFKNAVKIVKSQKGKRKRDFSYNKEIKTIRSDNILFKNSQMERGIDPNYNYIRESIKPETPNSPHFPCSIKLLSSDHLFTTINAKNQSVTKLPEKINEMGAPIHNKYLDCNLTITNIPPKSPKIKIVFDKNGGRNSPEQNHDIEEQPENILSTTINKTGAAIHKEYLDGDLRNTKILPKLTKKKIVFDKNSERNLQNNYIAEQPQNVEERTYVTFIVNKKLVQKEITEKNNCKLQNSPRKEQRNFRLLNSPRGTTENIFEESHLNIQENQLKCCENEPNLRKEATSPLIIHNNVQRESALGFSNASDLRLDQETSEDSFESDQMYSKKITHTLKFGAPAKRPPCRQILVAEKNKKWPSKSMSENKVSQNDPVLRGIVKLNVEPEKVGSCNIQRQVGLSCGDKRTPVAPDKFSGDSTSFKMPFLPSTLPKYSPKTGASRLNRMNPGSRTPYSTGTYQKDDDVISLYADSMIGLEAPSVCMDSKSISEPYNKIQNWMHTSPCVSETDINKDKTINFDDLQFENDLNVPSKPVREIPNELIGQNNYDCKRLFEYICPKIKKYGYCRNKKKCSSLHDFPYAWEEQLLEQPLNNFLSFYEDVKTKHENHLWKLLFPVVVKRSRESELYNKLSNLVVDVMEKDIDQDKTTFILMIVEALQEMGLTFTSSVEVIFNKAKLHPELKNSLADILLGIIVEKLTNLEDTWFVISMLTKDRNNVDTGIIQDIISIALKEPIDQHMCTKIYKDILVNVEDTQINSIFHTVLGRYIEALQTFNLIKEATTLQKRWKNSETVQNETQVKESLPSLDFNFVPSTNLNIVPEIRLLPSQYNPNIPPPVIIGSVQRPYEQPLVKGLDRMQQNRPGSVPIACNVPQSDEVNRSPMSDKVTLGQPYSLPGCSRNDQNTDNFKLQTQNWEKRKKTAPENLSTKNQKISPNQVGINNGYVGERTKTAFENANHSQTIYNSDGFRSNYAFVKTNSSSSASDEHFPVFKESSFLLNPLKEIHDIEMGPNSPARPNLRLKPGVLNKFSSTSNPPNYYFQQNSNILDLEAIRNAYTSENTSEIVRGIYSCHPNGINEYVRVVLDVLLNENHVIPTFYNNICDALVVSGNIKNKNEVSQAENILKTLGMNLLVHFVHKKVWGVSNRLLKTMISYFKNGMEHSEVFYNNQKYSVSRNLLIICNTFLKDVKNETSTVWHLLAIDCKMILKRSEWTYESNENDIEYRNFVFEEFMNTENVKNSKKSLIYLVEIARQDSDIDISVYLNMSLNAAVNNKIQWQVLEELNTFHPSWPYEVEPLLFRTVAVILFKSVSPVWSNILDIGIELEIYPQYNGNEHMLELHTHYNFEEVHMILTSFLSKRKQLKVTQPLQISTRNYKSTSSIQFFNVLGRPVTPKDMCSRIANVLLKKLNIKVNNDNQQVENNCVTISSTQLQKCFLKKCFK